MLPARPAVGQYIGVNAPRVLQRVGQDRHSAEGAFLVDGGGEPGGGAAVVGEDGGVDGRRGAEGVAEEVAEEGGLGSWQAATISHHRWRNAGSWTRSCPRRGRPPTWVTKSITISASS